MAINHRFVSTKTDDPKDSTIVRPSNWNDTHIVGNGTWVRSATKIVAASDSSSVSKSQADYVCDGVADDVEIQAANDAANGGSVQLMEGSYSCDSLTINSCTLRGMGAVTAGGEADVGGGTVVNLTDSSAEIAVGEDGRLHDLKVRVISGYTGTAVSVVGEATFTSRIRMLDNIIIEQAGWRAAGFTGTGLLLNSPAGTTLSYTSFGSIVINGFEYGFKATAASELSGNIFSSLIVQRSEYLITLDSSGGGSIAHNVFTAVTLDTVEGTVDAITLTKGAGTNAENKFLSVSCFRRTQASGVMLRIAASIYRCYFMGYFGDTATYVSDSGYDNTIINLPSAKFPSLGLTSPTELIISGGSVTQTQSYHTIDTEGDVASDNLDTIVDNGASQFCLIRAAHTDRTVVVKHGTGNIYLKAGVDISLDSTNKALLLFTDGTIWFDVGGGA